MFLEERMNDGGLENFRDGVNTYGSVDDVGNEGQELGKALRIEGGREGIKFAGFERHGGFKDFILRDRAER